MAPGPVDQHKAPSSMQPSGSSLQVSGDPSDDSSVLKASKLSERAGPEGEERGDQPQPPRVMDKNETFQVDSESEEEGSNPGRPNLSMQETFTIENEESLQAPPARPDQPEAGIKTDALIEPDGDTAAVSPPLSEEVPGKESGATEDSKKREWKLVGPYETDHSVGNGPGPSQEAKSDWEEEMSKLDSNWNKSQIKTCIRIKPTDILDPLDPESENIIMQTGPNKILINYDIKGETKQCEFAVDKVFCPDSSQLEVWRSISFCIDSIFEFKNATVFAHGHTGTGKTYTMIGPDVMDLIKKKKRRSKPGSKKVFGNEPQLNTSSLKMSNQITPTAPIAGSCQGGVERKRSCSQPVLIVPPKMMPYYNPNLISGKRNPDASNGVGSRIHKSSMNSEVNSELNYYTRHENYRTFEEYVSETRYYVRNSQEEIDYVLHSERKGMIPRACEEIMKRLHQLQESNDSHAKSDNSKPKPKNPADENDLFREVKVYASYMQIYNDRIFDLLNPYIESQPILNTLKSNFVNNTTFVSGLLTIEVQSIEELIELLIDGTCNRACRITKTNEMSTRSHSIFKIELKQTGAQRSKNLSGNLLLIDLAGNEKYEASNEKLYTTEVCSINRSLSALSLCINELSRGNKSISYRNSILTRLLQGSLGGSSKTVFICTVSSSVSNVRHTISSLQLAAKAKKIQSESKKLNSYFNEDAKKLRRELTFLKKFVFFQHITNKYENKRRFKKMKNYLLNQIKLEGGDTDPSESPSPDSVGTPSTDEEAKVEKSQGRTRDILEMCKHLENIYRHYEFTSFNALLSQWNLNKGSIKKAKGADGKGARVDNCWFLASGSINASNIMEFMETHTIEYETETDGELSQCSVEGAADKRGPDQLPGDHSKRADPVDQQPRKEGVGAPYVLSEVESEGTYERNRYHLDPTATLMNRIHRKADGSIRSDSVGTHNQKEVETETDGSKPKMYKKRRSVPIKEKTELGTNRSSFELSTCAKTKTGTCSASTEPKTRNVETNYRSEQKMGLAFKGDSTLCSNRMDNRSTESAHYSKSRTVELLSDENTENDRTCPSGRTKHLKKGRGSDGRVEEQAGDARGDSDEEDGIYSKQNSNVLNRTRQSTNMNRMIEQLNNLHKYNEVKNIYNDKTMERMKRTQQDPEESQPTDFDSDEVEWVERAKTKPVNQFLLNTYVEPKNSINNVDINNLVINKVKECQVSVDQPRSQRGIAKQKQGRRSHPSKKKNSSRESFPEHSRHVSSDDSMEPRGDSKSGRNKARRNGAARGPMLEEPLGRSISESSYYKSLKNKTIIGRNTKGKVTYYIEFENGNLDAGAGVGPPEASHPGQSTEQARTEAEVKKKEPLNGKSMLLTDIEKSWLKFERKLENKFKREPNRAKKANGGRETDARFQGSQEVINERKQQLENIKGKYRELYLKEQKKCADHKTAEPKHYLFGKRYSNRSKKLYKSLNQIEKMDDSKENLDQSLRNWNVSVQDLNEEDRDPYRETNGQSDLSAEVQTKTPNFSNEVENSSVQKMHTEERNSYRSSQERGTRGEESTQSRSNQQMGMRVDESNQIRSSQPAGIRVDESTQIRSSHPAGMRTVESVDTTNRENGKSIRNKLNKTDSIFNPKLFNFNDVKIEKPSEQQPPRTSNEMPSKDLNYSYQSNIYLSYKNPTGHVTGAAPPSNQYMHLNQSKEDTVANGYSMPAHSMSTYSGKNQVYSSIREGSDSANFKSKERNNKTDSVLYHPMKEVQAGKGKAVSSSLNPPLLMKDLYATQKMHKINFFYMNEQSEVGTSGSRTKLSTNEAMKQSPINSGFSGPDINGIRRKTMQINTVPIANATQLPYNPNLSQSQHNAVKYYRHGNGMATENIPIARYCSNDMFMNQGSRGVAALPLFKAEYSQPQNIKYRLPVPPSPINMARGTEKNMTMPLKLMAGIQRIPSLGKLTYPENEAERKERIVE